MKKIRLNENDIERLVKRIIKEEGEEGQFNVGDLVRSDRSDMGNYYVIVDIVDEGYDERTGGEGDFEYFSMDYPNTEKMIAITGMLTKGDYTRYSENPGNWHSDLEVWPIEELEPATFEDLPDDELYID